MDQDFDMTNKIDKSKMYTANEVVNMKVNGKPVLNWNSRSHFYEKLNEEKWKKIFKPVIDKKKILTRYFIKGEHIINYLKNKKNYEK